MSTTSGQYVFFVKNNFYFVKIIIVNVRNIMSLEEFDLKVQLCRIEQHTLPFLYFEAMLSYWILDYLHVFLVLY